MAKRALEFEVLRRNRPEAKWDDYGDPADTKWVEDQLARWLKAERWHKDLWSEFELVARIPRRSDVLTRVRG